MIAAHFIFIPFFFALGACVGSFLNVVVWRLPQIEQNPNDRSLFGPMLKTIEGLSNPPSHCPKCNNLLKWYDNIPVLGWLKLGGKCRFCKASISPRYPIVEAICGLLFVAYYVFFFIAQVGPCAAQPVMIADETLGTLRMLERPLSLQQDWPIYGLYMVLIAGLLASSLIDAELFIIPVEIPWLLAAIGIVAHAIVDKPSLPGALNATPVACALAVGGAVGLILSIFLWSRGVIPHSFPDGEPMQDIGPEDESIPQQDRGSAFSRGLRVFVQLLRPLLPVIPVSIAAWLVITQRPPVAVGGLMALAVAVGFWLLGKYPIGFDAPPEQPPEPASKPWSRGDLMREMGKEICFLLPPMLLASVAWLALRGEWWNQLLTNHWFTGLCGAILGALVGAFIIWVTRILGTLAFGRLAMGLGDVHLMFGVGAIVGAGLATVTFFLAPFFGILIALYLLLTGKRREIPYGPYLSLAAAFVLLLGCPIMAWLTPGAQGLNLMLHELLKR